MNHFTVHQKNSKSTRLRFTKKDLGHLLSTGKRALGNVLPSDNFIFTCVTTALEFTSLKAP